MAKEQQLMAKEQQVGVLGVKCQRGAGFRAGDVGCRVGD
jgi:hypothetical protein